MYEYSDGTEGTPNTNLFINYLSPDVTDEGLVNLFSRFGPIESAKVMLDLATGQSKCFGFVKFENVDQGLNVCSYNSKSFSQHLLASVAAKTMNGAKIGNKQLVVKYAHASTTVSSSDSDGGTPSNNVYVKGLPLNINPEQLKTLFNAYGTILESKILKDATTNLSRGMAFVRYSSTQEATASIQGLNNTLIPGVSKPIVVKYADTEEERNNRRQRTLRKRQQQQRYNPYAQVAIPNIYAQHYGLMASMGNGALGYGALAGYAQPAIASPNLQAVGSLPFSKEMSMSNHVANLLVSQALPTTPPFAPAPPSLYDAAGMPVTPDSNLFIYNLPPDADDALLYRLFSPCGAIASVKVIKDPTTTQCKGYGFVRMVNYFDAFTAIQNINGTKVGDRILQVSFKKSSGE